jgi:hypothetical protein
MEREMIHYLSFDLTISGVELEKFTQTVKSTYKRGVPKMPYVVIPDKSRENDHFGKGSLEIETRPMAKKSAIDVHPYSNGVQIPINTNAPISPEDDDSPGVESSSTNSSRTSSPPSPYLKTPPDDITIGVSNRPGAKHRGSLGEPRVVRDQIAAVRFGTDSNYASPSGW